MLTVDISEEQGKNATRWKHECVYEEYGYTLLCWFTHALITDSQLVYMFRTLRAFAFRNASIYMRKLQDWADRSE